MLLFRWHDGPQLPRWPSRPISTKRRTRTSETDANGDAVLLTAAADRDAQAALQHVVMTFDPINGRRIYVNGKATGDIDPLGGGGSLSDWDDSFALVLGAETSLGRQWQGVMRLVADPQPRADARADPAELHGWRR